MDYSILLKTSSSVDIWPKEPANDPLAIIRKLLPDVLPSLAHLECASGYDACFFNASRNSGSGVGNGFQPHKVTELANANGWLLAEGVNGSGINIGDWAPGGTVSPEPTGARMAMLLGPTKAATFSIKEIETALSAAESMLKERDTYAAIGIGGLARRMIR